MSRTASSARAEHLQPCSAARNVALNLTSRTQSVRGDRPTHQESARNLVSAVHAKKIDFCFLAASRAEAPALRGPRPPPGSLEAFSGGANAPSFARNGAEGAAQHPFYEIWPRGVAARRAAAIGDRGLQPPPTYMCFVAAVSGDEPTAKSPRQSLRENSHRADAAARLSRERGRRAGSSSRPRARWLRSRRTCVGSRSRPRCPATGLRR